MTNRLKIFSGHSNELLAGRIAEKLGVELGQREIRKFSDGEIWVKYSENIRGKDVFIVQSTHSPSDNLFELLIMIDAARRASARRITAVIPYFGYARQDRKDQPRVAITAKLVANLIATAGADRVLTMDLHVPQIQGFFDIPLDHLYASPVLGEYYKSKNISNLVVVSPDIGSNALARAYAGRLGTPLAIIDKRRKGQNISEVLNIIGDVNGKNVFIIDDIIDTAGTLVNAARALRECGAQNIHTACTHPVFSGEALKRLSDPVITEVTVTDTIFLNPDTITDKINVLSVSWLFGEAIKRIHKNESISCLFD